MPLYTNGIDVDIYADDIVEHASDKRQDIVETKLMKGATGFNDWCNENDMFINLKKTFCMLHGTRQKLIQVDQIEIMLESEIIAGLAIDRSI